MRYAHSKGLAAVLTALFAVACEYGQTVPPSFLGSRADCPHAWIWPPDSMQQHTGLHAALIGNVDLVQPIINVPEFHDCQRFVSSPGGRPEYREFFAIWASARLATLTADLTDVTAERLDSIGSLAPQPQDSLGSPAPRVEAMRPPDSSAFAVAAAEIYAEGYYGPLGIEPWLNCLYLYRRNQRWQARMIPMGHIDVRCDRIPPSASLPTGTELRVIATSFPEFKSERDYPPVARWDWDPTNQQQYIGIKCGAAWCEIGAELLTPSAPLAIRPSDSRALRRVKQIKGWYDQQYLADDRQGQAVPTGILGTIIPDTLLGRLDNFGDFARFTHVGDVVLTKTSAADDPALSKYRAKFNFSESTIDVPNKIFLCAGGGCTPAANEAAAACTNPSPWSARVMPAATAPGTSRLKCVTRRNTTDYFVGPVGAQAPVILVPGTTRWRWLRQDEGTWVRCMHGCCQMEID